MAAVSCEELFPGRRGQDDIDRRLGKTRVFEVITDDPQDDADVAAGHPDVPRNGDEHPTNSALTMTRITADNYDETPYLWLIVCEYTSDLPKEQGKEAITIDPATGNAVENPGASGGGPTDRETSPLDRPVVYGSEWETVTEPFEFDVNGDPVLNSAGYPFDPPAMVERSYMIITATKNYAVGDPILNFDEQADYQGGINDATWAGRAAGTCRILAISRGNAAYENGVTYAPVTFRIKHKPEGWQVRLIDRGYLDVLGARIETVQGNNIFPDEPTLLNGAGDPLAVGLPPEVLTFDAYLEVNFSALGI